MQPVSRVGSGQSSFSSREASSLTNVHGLKRTSDLFLSSDAGTRVVACADDAFKVSLESIHDEVKCPICLGIISNTRTFMECLHRFCAECIEKYIRVRKKECPQCRMHCSSKRSLRPDKRFDSLINALYPDRQTIELQENMIFDNPEMLVEARARLEKFTEEVQYQAKRMGASKSVSLADSTVKLKRLKRDAHKRKEKADLKLQAKEKRKQKMREEKKMKKRKSRKLLSADPVPAPSEEAAPPRKRIKFRVSSASKEAKSEFAPSFGVEDPSVVHEDDMRQVELMLYAFDGSPSLDKVAYLCPGNLRVRALRRFIKASLAQSGHVVSKVSIVVELAGVLPGDLTVAAVRDVVCAGHPFFSVVLHYSTG